MLALVVDDSRATRSMLRTMLGKLGFEVVEAGHGLQALDRLSALDGVDFALVDWNMPEMDGSSSCARCAPSDATRRYR